MIQTNPKQIKDPIVKVEMWNVKIPLKATFYPSWIPGFPQKENRFDLIKLTTKSGISGWSACQCMSKERQGIGYLIAPYIIGEDPTNIELIQQRIKEMSFLGLRNGWIEPACWDIIGKMQGKPVCDILANNDKCHEKLINLYASLGQVYSPEEAVEVVQQMYDEGFTGVKLRVHQFSEQDDMKQVQAVCEKFGNKMKIGVDANQAWRVTAIADAPKWDLERAKRFADFCAENGVSWLEEPQNMDNYEDQAELAAYSKVPISGGELHSQGYSELKMMIEKKCYNIFQPDAIFTGGIKHTFDICQLCKKHNLIYTPHTWTNGIGFAVNLQLMAASGFSDKKLLEYPYNPPGWMPNERDGLLKEPFIHKQGTITVPNKPGLGFEIDEEQLKKYGTKYFTMDELKLKFFVLFDRGLKTALEIDNAKRQKQGLPIKSVPSFLKLLNFKKIYEGYRILLISVGFFCFYRFLIDNKVSFQNSKYLIGFSIFSIIGFLVCRKLFVTSK